MGTYTGADAFLEVINRYGVEHIFFNPGIDNALLIEAISRYSAYDKSAPKSILCLDESVAMHAAYGNYMATGKAQVVLVHSELGTMQIGGALHNAQWGKIPVIFCAEHQGPPGRVNWRQEPFDQGGMVRNFVKWDHQLQDGEDLREILQKAFHIATSEPYGPVYLILPRDIYNMEMTRSYDYTERDYDSNISTPGIDINILDVVADNLIKAKNPLIITGYLGRNHQAVSELVLLSETLCSKVLTADVWMNFPNNHPLFVIIDPDTPWGGPSCLSTADVILAVDYDMHYAAPPTVPDQNSMIIHMDMDLNKKGEPLWKRMPDLSVLVDSGIAIPALRDIISKKLTEHDRDRMKRRFDDIKQEHDRLREKWRSMAITSAEQTPITPDWLCHCINEVITEETVIVNQTITPSASVVHQIKRIQPSSMFSCAGGSIGWALGAGLGVKLGFPDRDVISLMGDGAFVYGCPVATLWSSVFYSAPFLSIIFNNQAYNAIKMLFRETYNVDNMGADILNPPDYAMVAQSCNAYGRTVQDPSDVIPALKEALEQIRKGKPAVLDVRLK
jgi:acetolactate synthase-1/2/3 large subunit